MELTMLENGLDFVIRSISYLISAEKEDTKSKNTKIKYSLLHLSSGIELILKSRLYIEHWTYIFSDMNKADKNLLENGDFRSVESTQIIERLEKLCSVSIDSGSKNAYKNLRKCRNQMEHFSPKDNFLAIEACINSALTAITKFIKENYSDFQSPPLSAPEDVLFGLNKRESKLIDILINKTAKLEQHYKDAVSMATAKAESEADLNMLMKCPSCKEKLLNCNYNNQNICYCYFCLFKETGEATSKKYISEILHINEYEAITNGETYPLYTCPDCKTYSLVHINDMYRCFNCGYYYNETDIAFCDECGMPYYNYYDENDLGLCDSCKEYKFRD